MRKYSIVVFLISAMASAQSVTTVELYGPAVATDVYNGLGTNITPTNLWEFQAAQAAHITWGRYDSTWAVNELQTCPANTSGGYSLSSIISTALGYAATYGVRPSLTADYGPPYCAIATGTVTSNVSIGATTVAMTVSTGALTGVVGGQTCLQIPTGWISSKHGYCGTLIQSVSGTTLTLTTAATEAVSSGTALTVNLLLYPPVLVTPGTSYTANTSVQAYYNYVHFLATQITAASVSGQVELWNEPAWPDECWDAGTNCYDSPPPVAAIYSGFGLELPGYTAGHAPTAGVTWGNGYTDKTGDGSLFSPTTFTSFPPGTTIQNNFATESFHPYGNNPEDHAWAPACIHQYNSYTNVLTNCTPVGANSGSNWKWQAAFNAFPYTFGGLRLNITESGIQRSVSPTPTEAQISRWTLRQFLTFQGAGVTPVMFYRLAGDQNFAWFQSQGNPYPVYTAFQNLMSDIGTIASSPVAPYAACMMPRVSSYTGYYPLATAMFVGSQSGNKANSILYYTWQRSYSAGNWVSLASPASVNVSVVVPTGMTVSAVKDTVTAGSVSFTFTSGTLTYAVADDPVEALLVPTSATAQAALGCT